MYENLKKKYSITDKELRAAVTQINFGKIRCGGDVLAAILDLICNGDIADEKSCEGAVDD